MYKHIGTDISLRFGFIYRIVICLSEEERTKDHIRKQVSELNVQIHFDPGNDHINSDLIFSSKRDDYIGKKF